MDRVSELPDELLVNILSFVPTKVAVSTCILSTQWKFIWMLLPKLEYWIRKQSECKSLDRFLDRNLPLHRAKVIESFRLDSLPSYFKPEKMKSWVLTAVSRNLRELEISLGLSNNELNILPSSLYTCKSLVTLKLKGGILVDVPRMVCLPCLKTLQLREVKYFNEDSFQRLLSICPVLEDLSVEGQGYYDNNMVKCIVIVPLLQRLTLNTIDDIYQIVIDTPSLKYLRLDYYNTKDHYCLIQNMPKLEEAYVDVCFDYSEKLIRSITSVKSLKLCGMDVYLDDFFFNQLEHLQLCTCKLEHLSRVLVRFLKDSPNLRVLELFPMEFHDDPDDMYLWNQPSTVPECMLSSLQTFKWSGYLGTPEERALAIYILKNAKHLKIATILFSPHLVPTDDMIMALASSSRASTSCQLLFD